MLVLEAMTLQELLSTIGSIFTALVGYVGDICNAIAAQPLLLIGFALPFAFAVVSFVRRLFYVG